MGQETTWRNLCGNHLHVNVDDGYYTREMELNPERFNLKKLEKLGYHLVPMHDCSWYFIRYVPEEFSKLKKDLLQCACNPLWFFIKTSWVFLSLEAGLLLFIVWCFLSMYCGG
jgi:hypothetical protein